jgi:flagellum-specific peptidoglycan hydrolase FlgJ
MGKNKWYNETDGAPNPAFRTSDSNASPRQKKSNSLPGLFVNNSQEEITLASFWKASLKRFKRNWLALKFKSNRLTSQTLSKTNLAKVGVLAGVAYFFFFRNVDSSATLASGSSAISWKPETNLSVGAEKKKATPVAKKVKKAPASEAAPVSKDHMRSDQTAAYIRKFSGIAREEMRKYGVPASISLAQGLIESRAGSSKLAVNNNNHFGMKCFSRNCRKGHCTNFTDDTHKDFFLKFNTAQESWKAHSKLLAAGRYAKLKKHGRDYRRWAQGLKSVGYATDRTYAQKLIGIIERYELHQYDR